MSFNQIIKLEEVAFYSSGKIVVENVDEDNYISTENLIPNYGGKTVSSGRPNVNNVTEYKADDVLISNIRPYFKKIWRATCKGGASNDVLVVSPKSNIIPKFLYYSLANDKFFDYVMSGAKGTKMPRGDKSHIMGYKFNLPSLKEQKLISNVLSTLDEKIEVNNQINKTLENMAQAIFKQWFVDFEFPNEAGEPYKSSGGEMVESELGMIPEGWGLNLLSELGKIVTGKTPSTKDENNFGIDFNFVTPRDVKEELHIIKTERQLSMYGAKKIKNCKVKRNSIGVTCIGSNLGKVYINSVDSYTNQQINSLELSNELTHSYVFMVLKGYREKFINMSGGSAVPIINKTAFSSIKIIMPEDKILNEFAKISDEILRIIEANQVQINLLVKVRDSLLPKLMSGEIRVPLDSEGEIS